MSELLKEWNKLAFKKGNRSINERYDDGLGNYEGEEGYSEMDNSYEDQVEVDEILNDAKSAGLQPGCSYDDFLTCCEDWFDGPQEHTIVAAYEIFSRR